MCESEKANCGGGNALPTGNGYKSVRKEFIMMKVLMKIWEAITAPFVSVAVLIDESKRINEDGSWDKYWARKNRKEK